MLTRARLFFNWPQLRVKMAQWLTLLQDHAAAGCNRLIHPSLVFNIQIIIIATALPARRTHPYFVRLYSPLATNLAQIKSVASWWACAVREVISTSSGGRGSSQKCDSQKCAELFFSNFHQFTELFLVQTILLFKEGTTPSLIYHPESRRTSSTCGPRGSWTRQRSLCCTLPSIQRLRAM
jgi:hypothetical protein